MIASGYRAFFWNNENVNILKAIELYALNGWIIWHMNYILIKVFLKTYTEPGSEWLRQTGTNW